MTPRFLSRIGRALGPGGTSACSLDTAQMPGNEKVYAIGDVHGHRDLLARILDLVDEDIQSSGTGLKCRIVALGDYVDRGPDSSGVIELLAGLEADERRSYTWLKGNHEEMLLSFLDAPEEFGPGWLDFGGLMTLLSYVESLPGPARDTGFRGLRDALAARLPEPHLRFLERLEISCTAGDFFFCHAGARPEIPLTRQSERDLLWIRQDTGDDDPPFDKVVVHGHTPVSVPEVRRHRINIDTGAFATGVLTCLAIDVGAKRLLQVASGMADARWRPLVP